MQVRTWVDGALVGDQPAIVALDHGVTVGDGVFETAKVVDGAVFARRRHHDRLDRSLAGLGLPAADRDRIDEGIAAVLEGLTGTLRLRYTVTSGVGPPGSDRVGSPYTYIVAAVPVPAPPASSAIVTVPWTRNERSAVAGLKTTSYAENVVALAYAKERDAGEAIFANTRDELCEGTGSNIFVVKDGVAFTPPLSSGALAGITRGLALEWGRQAGIEMREETMSLDVLESCDEVFITSSTRDIQPVHRVDGRDVAAPGPVTKAIADAFSEGAERDNDPA